MVAAVLLSVAVLGLEKKGRHRAADINGRGMIQRIGTRYGPICIVANDRNVQLPTLLSAGLISLTIH